MKDTFGRKIEYLRLSVTERCNLNCIYCREIQGHGHNKNDNPDVSKELTPSQIELVVKSFANLGIKNVRLTGGEPLMRNDICEIVERIAKIDGISDLSLTTNAFLLTKYAKPLKTAGLNRLNISLDSLKPERLNSICRNDNTGKIFEGIEVAILEGFTPTRLNTVLIAGINDDEIDDFIQLPLKFNVDLRFIELMPMSIFGSDNKDKIIKNSQIIERYPELIPIEQKDSQGPAKYYKLPGYLGNVGFISPISDCFCHSCNRIRLTHDGKVRPCLGNNQEIDIIDNIINNNNLDEVLAEIILKKPHNHCFSEPFTPERKMNQIGG